MEGWTTPAKETRSYKRPPRIVIPPAMLKALAEGRETYAGVARALGTTYATISKRLAADNPAILRARQKVLERKRLWTIPGKMRAALSAGKLGVAEAAASRSLPEDVFLGILGRNHPALLARLERMAEAAGIRPCRISTGLTGRMITTLKAGEASVAGTAEAIGCRPAALRRYLEAHHPKALAGAMDDNRPPGVVLEEDLVALAAGRLSVNGLARRSGLGVGALHGLLARDHPDVVSAARGLVPPKIHHGKGKDHYSARITSLQIRRAVAGAVAGPAPLDVTITSLAEELGVHRVSLGDYLRAHHADCRG